jgi:hypothetical protein
MATGFFAADLAIGETRATGVCTKCRAVREDDWAGCPLDRYCPAPDSARRHEAMRRRRSPQSASPRSLRCVSR